MLDHTPYRPKPIGLATGVLSRIDENPFPIAKGEKAFRRMVDDAFPIGAIPFLPTQEL